MADYYDLPPLTTDEAKPGSRDYDIVQWCETRLKRGIEFVEGQRGYDLISRSIDEIFSTEGMTDASYVPGKKALSRTRANLVAKIAEDLTAMMTDTRMFWNYTTKNPKYQTQFKYANKDATQWYENRMIDLRIGDVIRNYTVAGTGFAHLYWSRRLNDVMLESEDPRNVFPIDPLSYHTVQDCAGVIMRRPRTPDWVKEEFDKTVKPDAGGAGGFFGWLSRVIDGPGERGGPLSRKSNADKPIPASPTVFVNTMYLRDTRKNESGKTVRMGKWEDDGKGGMRPANPWSYQVKEGGPLFPFHRMIVWGGGALLYDGPSPYWHAKFPLIKFTLNPWPGSWFGKAPIWDCLPLQGSINSNLRVIDDHAAKVAQPGVVADRNVSRAEMNKVDTRAPGMKIKTNMASGKGIQMVNPPPLDSVIWESIKWCDEKMKTLAGTMDPSTMAGLGQIPSDDTIDTIMKAMTPGVRLRSRILEGAYKELAEMYLYCIFEFKSLTRRINELGPTAVSNEDFDFEPGTMIPDDIPDGDTGDIANQAIGLDGPRPLYARCRAMLASAACQFDPSSLLNSSMQQELMKWFLLAKMGYASVFTLMEKMGQLASFVPAGMDVPADELGRLALQSKLGIGMISNSQGRKATNQEPASMGQNAAGPIIQTS